MASITIRNLPEETYRALCVRAAMHGHSAEAEIRAILENALRPEGRVKLGSLLAEIGQEAGGVDLEIECDSGPMKLAWIDASITGPVETGLFCIFRQTFHHHETARKLALRAIARGSYPVQPPAARDIIPTQCRPCRR